MISLNPSLHFGHSNLGIHPPLYRSNLSKFTILLHCNVFLNRLFLLEWKEAGNEVNRVFHGEKESGMGVPCFRMMRKNVMELNTRKIKKPL